MIRWLRRVTDIVWERCYLLYNTMADELGWEGCSLPYCRLMMYIGQNAMAHNDFPDVTLEPA